MKKEGIVTSKGLLTKLYETDGFYGITQSIATNKAESISARKQITKYAIDTAKEVHGFLPNQENPDVVELRDRLHDAEKNFENVCTRDSSGYFHNYTAPVLNAVAACIMGINENDQNTLQILNDIIPSKEEAENTAEAICKKHDPADKRNTSATSGIGKVFPLITEATNTEKNKGGGKPQNHFKNRILDTIAILGAGNKY